MATRRLKKNAAASPYAKLHRKILDLREEVEENAYEANFHQAMGNKSMSGKYFARLRRNFEEADTPEMKAEDVRHDLQQRAAKERKRALASARQKMALARRLRVASRGGKRVGAALKPLSKWQKEGAEREAAWKAKQIASLNF